jgi:hypothetical protein
VTDTGPDTLGAVAVTDTLGLSISCPDPSLAPGGSESCRGSYTVTQADVDAGSVTDSATASATDGSTPVTSPSTSVTVEASDATSNLSLTKSATTTHADNGYGAAGDVISYGYLVKDTGTTTVSGIAVTDNKVSGVTCPQPSLAPGGSEPCSGSYTVTQGDVAAGAVTNTATAGATSVQGPVDSKPPR